MARKSLDQLRQMTWRSQPLARQELKRNGFSHQGDDYHLIEFKKGWWHIAERSDDHTAELGLDAAPPKEGRSTKEHPADVRAREQIAKAVGYDIHFRVSPRKRIDERAATLEEARKIADRLNVEHGKHGRRAMIYARQARGAPVPIGESPPGRQPHGARRTNARTNASQGVSETSPPISDASPRTDAPGTTPGGANDVSQPSSGADLSPLPPDGGPYTFRIDPTTTGVVAEALAIVRQLSRSTEIKHSIVRILGPDGTEVRHVDAAAIKIAVTGLRRSGGGGGGGRGRGGDSKQGRAIALLVRPNGATAKEINAVTDWPVGQRHINRLAKVSKKKIEALGDKHWRLVT